MKTLSAAGDGHAHPPSRLSVPHASLISIVVCTRNRAQKLQRTLQAIKMMDIPIGADYEVIVIDNGSTDSTEQVCSQMLGIFQGRLSRILLEQPGLSRAGNAGIRAARGEIVAFLDDDVLPREDWLSVVAREFSSDPQLGAISGRVELFKPTDLPMAVRRQEERLEFHSPDHAFGLLIGCNLIVRKTVFQRVGLFDPSIGTGTRFGSAGDSDFFYRAWKAGERLVYVPSLFVYHDHGRHTRDDKLKVSRDYVIGRGAFYAKHILQRDFAIARWMYWELHSAWRSVFRSKDELAWRHIAWLLKGSIGYTLMRAARSIGLRR